MYGLFRRVQSPVATRSWTERPSRRLKWRGGSWRCWPMAGWSRSPPASAAVRLPRTDASPVKADDVNSLNEPYTRATAVLRGRPDVLIAVLAFVVYACYSLVSLARFRAGAYDLVIFDQAIRSYASFGEPISLLKGVHNEFGTAFSVLGDHWSPILVLLAPLYWIHDGPETLLVAQAFLLAAPIPFLWSYAKNALGSAKQACAVVIAYAISWPIVETVAFDFHEAAFVPLLTILVFERYQKGHRGQAILAALLLLLVKEDMGLLVAGLAALLLFRKGERWLGVLGMVVGFAYSLIAVKVLIPAFGGRSNYYWAYSALGRDFGEVAVNAVTNPLLVIQVLLEPLVKMQTVALLLLPVLFTALFSPIAIALVPLLMERMLASSFPNWWGTQYHYNAFIVIIVFVAGIDGVQRIARQLVGWWSVAIVVVAVALVPMFSLGKMFTLDFYASTTRTEAAERVTSVIPDGALVEAANYLAPALSHRTRTML